MLVQRGVGQNIVQWHQRMRGNQTDPSNVRLFSGREAPPLQFYLHSASRHRACVPSSDALSLWSYVALALSFSIAPPPAFWFPCCLLCRHCAPVLSSTALFSFLTKSAETRRHLVRMVLVEGTTAAAASRSLSLSVRSASRYLGYFLDTGGALHYAPDRWNRHADNA